MSHLESFPYSLKLHQTHRQKDMSAVDHWPQCKLSMCAMWMRLLSAITVDPHPLLLQAHPYLSLSFYSYSLCVSALFLLFKHPRHRCLCLVTITKTLCTHSFTYNQLFHVARKARYEQNSQTRGIMPRNMCLVISWLLQTGQGDVNVINLARLTQRTRSGI